MVSESPDLSIDFSIEDFFSGRMTEEERLRMLDDPDAVSRIREGLPSFSLDQVSSLPARRSEADKLKELLQAGEIEFARDLILSLDKIEGYEELLQGARIDLNGRPWPSEFCEQLKEKASWAWSERSAKIYKIFAMLVECCPEEAQVDTSLRLDRIENLNLAEPNAEAFFEGIRKFPELKSLSLKDDHEGLSEKCPRLTYLDFRRSNGDLNLGLLAGCENLEELNLLNTSVSSLSDLPVLPKLKRIDLRRCWSLQSLDSMPGLPALEELELAHSHKLESLGNLGRFPSLRLLNARNCGSLSLPDDPDELGIPELILPEESEA